MTRYQDWMRRYVRGQLGFGDEFWGPLTDHPAYPALLERLEQLGRDPSVAKYYLVRHLLLDVIYAAGAVEYTVVRIDALLDEAQAVADACLPFPSADEWPSDGFGISSEAVDAVGFEFGNLLGWARAVGDRIRRPASGLKSELGLLPAMNPDHPSTEKVRELFVDVLTAPGTMKDIAQLAAFSLHASTVPTRGDGAQITKDGKVIVPLPDRLVEKVWSPEEFTYRENRDLRTFSHALLETTSRFVDKLLEIFEDYQEDVRWMTT